jgi:hypothetical protein
MENVPVGPNSKPLRPVIVTEVRFRGHQERSISCTSYLSHELLLCYSTQYSPIFVTKDARARDLTKLGHA